MSSDAYNKLRKREKELIRIVIDRQNKPEGERQKAKRELLKIREQLSCGHINQGKV